MKKLAVLRRALVVLLFFALNFAYAQQTFQGPSFTPASIVNSASFEPGMSPGSFFTIFGENLAPATQTWEGAIQGNSLPTQLAGVSVTVGGRPAYLAYVSPRQLNVLLPTDAVTGPAELQVTTPQGSASAAVEVQPQAPGLFAFWLDPPYAVATHSDFSLVTRSGPPPSPAGRPAQAGEGITLWGTGFGPTAELAPSGQLISHSYPLASLTNVSVTLGGKVGRVTSAAVVFPGLYQISVLVPADLVSGDHAVLAEVNGVRTQNSAFIPIVDGATLSSIFVSFRLDPWLISGNYVGGLWASPTVLGPATQGGGTFILETRAEGLDAQGQIVGVSPLWIPANPSMVAVTPAQGNQVKITVQQAGQSSLHVTYQGVTRELLIKATVQGDALVVEIDQL